MWFEGIEKKLEIIFSTPNRTLRQNSQCWQNVVRACGAEIISHTQTTEMDAYLLSESSLFVWDDRILMITCGKTRLINSVFVLLECVSADEIAQVFYERKNLLFPTEQCSDFEADVERLSAVFPGKSFRFGAANAEHVHMFFYGAPMEVTAPDTTLQILMNDIGGQATDAFWEKTKQTEASVAWREKLFLPFQKMQRDEFYFSPQGYSCNCIYNDQYMTIHISPQKESSYTSFEMNSIHAVQEDVIKTVISSFEPQHAFVAVTTSLDSQSMDAYTKIKVPDGYQTAGKGTYESENGYFLTYISLFKK